MCAALASDATVQHSTYIKSMLDTHCVVQELGRALSLTFSFVIVSITCIRVSHWTDNNVCGIWSVSRLLCFFSLAVCWWFTRKHTIYIFIRCARCVPNRQLQAIKMEGQDGHTRSSSKNRQVISSAGQRFCGNWQKFQLAGCVNKEIRTNRFYAVHCEQLKVSSWRIHSPGEASIDLIVAEYHPPTTLNAENKLTIAISKLPTHRRYAGTICQLVDTKSMP